MANNKKVKDYDRWERTPIKVVKKPTKTAEKPTPTKKVKRGR